MRLEFSHSFEFAGGFDGVSGPGFCFEPGFFDVLSGHFADAVCPLIDAFERLDDLFDDFSIGFDECECEFLIVIVRADVGHVDGRVAEVCGIAVFECFIGHGSHIADDFCASFEEEESILLKFSFGEPWFCLFRGGFGLFC